LPSVQCVANCGGGSFKSQMKRADKSGAQFAVIVGERELADGTVLIKPLRNASLEQQQVAREDMVNALQTLLAQ
jgi:histidyl-tRNA synthetase